MIIYKVTNLKNGKIYIGQTTKTLNERKRGHLKHMRAGSNVYFHRALRKYGIENFKWSVIDAANTIDELNDLEIKYINEFNTYVDSESSNGYNMTIGGLNASPSEKTKEILREYALEQFKNGHPNRGKTFEEIYGNERANTIKKKLKNVNLGRKLTNEHKEKIRKGNLGKSVSEEFRERMSKIVMGRKHTELSKEKISKSLIGNNRHLGKLHTEETKKIISNKKKGKPTWNATPILQISMNGEVVNEWRSATFAAKELGLSQGNINMVINGKRNSTGGFKWKLK